MFLKKNNKKIGYSFFRNFNNEALAYSFYYCYSFILIKSIPVPATKTISRHRFDPKRK